MIDYLNGRIAELLPAKVILDVNGVGYDINISLYTYTALQGKEEAKVYIYENIREDAWVLFGFASQDERNLFLDLTSVSGIGGNTARTILSSISPAELCQAISQGNEHLLCNIKGIGKRSAQRIIVELKDKIPVFGGDAMLSPEMETASKITPEAEEKIKEAVQALTMLGFAPAPTKKAVKAIMDSHPDVSTEELIKWALKAI